MFNQEILKELEEYLNIITDKGDSITFDLLDDLFDDWDTITLYHACLDLLGQGKIGLNTLTGLYPTHYPSLQLVVSF